MFKNNICKVIISCLISIVFISLICTLYSNGPLSIISEDGATDHVWENNDYYFNATEGFSFSKINNDGYNNDFDYSKGKNIATLILGSSQMESFNVGTKASTAVLLDNLYGDNDDVYNIGISGHTFLTCVSNLENALNKYKPNDFFIIETNTICFDDETLEKCINNSLDEVVPKNTDGLAMMLKKNSFVTTAISQAKSFINSSRANGEANESSVYTDFYNDNNIELIEKVLNEINKESKKYSCGAIILYDPVISLNKEGQLCFSEEEYVDSFRTLCEKNSIIFVDMSNRFLSEYCDNNILPYGFSNTAVGKGHLNKNGHKMVAEELYKVMKEVN